MLRGLKLGRTERRSQEAIQRRFINKLVSRNTYRDVKLDESINTLTWRQIEDSLYDKFGAVRPRLHPLFIMGEVTSDSRGRGSLQQIQSDEE